MENDARLAFLQELIPKTIGLGEALERQRRRKAELGEEAEEQTESDNEAADAEPVFGEAPGYKDPMDRPTEDIPQDEDNHNDNDGNKIDVEMNY